MLLISQLGETMLKKLKPKTLVYNQLIFWFSLTNFHNGLVSKAEICSQRLYLILNLLLTDFVNVT